jgi:hypothetical protein
MAIRTFKGKYAKTILVVRQVPKGFPPSIARIAPRVLINSAAVLGDLAKPPGNQLEATD